MGGRYAIVTTHNRPEMLRACVDSIRPQVDVVIVVDNASDPPVTPVTFDHVPDNRWRGHDLMCLRTEEQPVNLPRMWKMGLAFAAGHAARDATQSAHHVAFLCDDTVVPTGWFSAVVGEMQCHGAVMGSVNPQGLRHLSRVFGAVDNILENRACPWAFIIDGSKGLVPDESMHFWWCDTDLDWQARQAGGTVLLGTPNLVVHNIEPNHYLINKPGLSEQAGRDTEAFIKKWGYRPW